MLAKSWALRDEKFGLIWLGLVRGFLPIPLALAPLGFVRALQLQPRHPLGRSLIAGWVAVCLLFFGVYMGLGLVVRFLYFAAPLLCLGLGALFDLLWQRHGRLVVIAPDSAGGMERRCAVGRRRAAWGRAVGGRLHISRFSLSGLRQPLPRASKLVAGLRAPLPRQGAHTPAPRHTPGVPGRAPNPNARFLTCKARRTCPGQPIMFVANRKACKMSEIVSCLSSADDFSG